MKKILLAGTAVTGLLAASPATAATGQAPAGSGLGVYLSSMPDGNNSTHMANFKTDYDSFVKVMGQRPSYVLTYVDFSQGFAKFPSLFDWAIWSIDQSGPGYMGAGETPQTIPIIGVPMVDNVPANSWGNVLNGYKVVISGAVDAAFTGIVDAVFKHGYKSAEFRIGWEWDGSWYPWCPCHSKDPKARTQFIAAFRHIATLLKQEGAAKGVAVKIVWNPGQLNWVPWDITTFYPGDDVVDIISTDTYKDSLPVTNEQPAPGQIGPGGWSWTSHQALVFAQQHGKAFAVDETGGSQTDDDPSFPAYLAQQIAPFKAAGLPIDHVAIWNAGKFAFDPTAASPKPNEAAAWAKYFGPGPQSVTKSDR